MEHTYKALEMAAGVMLAIMIMSLIAYFFSQISVLPQEEDKIQVADQLAKFNLEYEVYDKKMMYGVDVISCLNKAQSNNEKYAEGKRFLAGQKYGEAYYIDVIVKINSPLEEFIEIYKYDTTQNRIIPRTETTPLTGIKMEDIFAVKSTSYTNFSPTSDVKKGESKLIGSGYMVENVEYNLLSNDKILANLIDFSNSNMRQVANNRDSNKLHEWSSAIWETALYDLKTRRFKCIEINYSEVTGQVNRLVFHEID